MKKLSVLIVILSMFALTISLTGCNDAPKPVYLKISASETSITGEDGVTLTAKDGSNEVEVSWGLGANLNDADKNNDVDSSALVTVTQTGVVKAKTGVISGTARVYGTLKSDPYRYGWIDITIDIAGLLVPEGPSVSKITLYNSTGAVTEYNTIQAALNAIPTTGTDTYTIRLPKGTYNENYLNYKGSSTIKISGDTTEKYGADVIITGHGTDMAKEKGRELIEIQGACNFILENVTLLSDYSRKDHGGDVQAEVLGYDGTGIVAAINCAFKSHQDTMRTTGKGWFYKCYIEGDTDFMWMEAAGLVALYEDCEIVSVYDNYSSTHTSYLTAPRATRTSTMWKGLVVYNSKVSIQSGQETYLFRNPWNVNETIYNNAAFVNVKINGTLNGVLAKSEANGTADQKYVGWKIDTSLASQYPSKVSSIGVVDDALKSKEYNGRRAILNRVFDTATSKFTKDNSKNWNVDSFIQENGWKVALDNSKELLDGESELRVVTYTMNTDTVPSGLTCSGFAKENGKDHYSGKTDSTISFDVTGPCKVSVTGYYQGNGTIKCASQGEAVYNFTNGSTNTTITKDYIVYKTGTNTVTVTASGPTYITQIVITYDDSLTFVPVTGIALSTKDNAVSVKAKKTLQFTAAITPATATNKDVKWTVSSDAASIDSTGLLTVNSVNSNTQVTVRCTSMDEKAFYSEKTITIEAVADTVIDFTWLDNTSASFTGKSSNSAIATADEAVCAAKDADGNTGTWKYNSSKLSGEGISLTTTDADPKRDDWYIDFPITAVKALKITDITINWGNCGTGNMRAYVTYSKNNASAVVISDDDATSVRSSDTASSKYSVSGLSLAAGDSVKIRICIHGYRKGSSTPQTFSGKSPTWGKVVIDGEAL